MDSTTHRDAPIAYRHLRLVSNRDTQCAPEERQTLPDGSVLRRIAIRVPGGGMIWVTARRRQLRVTVQVVSELAAPLLGRK